MEHLLTKLARQLDALDEASLMSLWNQYATKVSHFEPTKRWEEAALILSLIQAKRWKNQLFNYHWAKEARPDDSTAFPTALAPSTENFSLEPPAPTKQRCKVLRFRSLESDETT